jgi:predicted ArsR family transcriptional regulator
LLKNVLEEQGFVTSIEPRGSDGATVELCHCPIWALAERFPVVCRLEKGMMEAIFADADLELVEQRRDGAASCRWTVREASLASNSAT